jgi:hypothetical protein
MTPAFCPGRRRLKSGKVEQAVRTAKVEESEGQAMGDKGKKDKGKKEAKKAKKNKAKEDKKDKPSNK